MVVGIGILLLVLLALAKGAFVGGLIPGGLFDMGDEDSSTSAVPNFSANFHDNASIELADKVHKGINTQF